MAERNPEGLIDILERRTRTIFLNAVTCCRSARFSITTSARRRLIARNARMFDFVSGDAAPEVETNDPFERAECKFSSCYDAKLTVSRYLGGGREKYLCRVQYTPEIHTPDWLRDRFGPGTFRLRFGRTGNPREWSQVFSIAELKTKAKNRETIPSNRLSKSLFSMKRKHFPS